MAEASENIPTLGQIDRNPQIVAKHELDNMSLTLLQSLSETIQETANRSEKEMVAGGVPQDEAKEIAFNPGKEITSKIMETEVKNALYAGADEYAIMAAIHKGAVEGGERSKHSPVVNYFRDIVGLVKSKFVIK